MAEFSVVIPLYNKQQYIANAVTSVLGQTVGDFELLVVDDGSTDDSLRIVLQYDDPRIRVITRSNAGVSAARNTGIDAARSELIAFLDADDEWDTGFLAKIRQLRRRHPAAGLYATAYRIRLTDGRNLNPRFCPDPEKYLDGEPIRYFHFAARSQSGPVCSSACCVPKDVFRAVGGFAVDQTAGEDIDMWGRIALRYPVVWSSYPGAAYWQGDAGSASRAYVPARELPFVRTARRALAAGEVRDEVIPELKEYVTFLQILQARQCVHTGNYPLAIKLLLGADTTPLQWRAKLWWLAMAVTPRQVFTLARNVKRYLAAQLKERVTREEP